MILDEIAETARCRVEFAKIRKPLTEIKKEALNAAVGENTFIFEKTLKKKGLSFICEIKKASPSKGIIAEDFPYVKISEEYEKAGADAISVLTEPYYFKGADGYLTEIKKTVNIPILRKDFTVDAYQIYEAKLIGADAVLLICSLLDTPHLKEYIRICDSLGISALVEAHDENQIDSALEAGARIIGINNRDLATFQIDPENSAKLRSKVPKNIIFVAESGIKSRDDTMGMEKIGADAVLVGETMMRACNKSAALKNLRGK